MAAAMPVDAQPRPGVGGDGGQLGEVADGLTAWIQYWQAEPAGDSAGEQSSAAASPILPLPPVVSPEREKAMKAVRDAGSGGGVNSLVENITTLLENKESFKKEAAQREVEVKELKAQLELAQSQLAEAKRTNSRLGLDKPRSRPLSSHSRASVGQKSQTDMSTHSLLGRCLSSASQRSMESRLESSLDDIDDALNIIQRNTGNPDKAVRSLLNATRDQVKFALGELQAIVTHDDNLERQYKEAVVTNSQLERDLDRTKREMRHLKAKFSISELTPFAVRKEKARQREIAASRQKITREMQRSQAKAEAQLGPLRTARERSQTVNARGEYFNSHGSASRSQRQPQALDRSPTRPAQVHRRSLSEPLPPPIVGCKCSVCRSVQSLGATTASHLRGNVTTRPANREIQQIVLGDRITLKGGRKGMVKYIGRLHSEAAGLTIFIGIHLDQPVGRHSGTLDGRRYFSCPANHGLFVTVSDVLDVGGKAISCGPSLPASRAPGTSRTLKPLSRQPHPPSNHLQLSRKTAPRQLPAADKPVWPPTKLKDAKPAEEMRSSTTTFPSIRNNDISLTASKVEERSQPSRATTNSGRMKQSVSTIATTRTRTTPAALDVASREVHAEDDTSTAHDQSNGGIVEEEIDNLSQRLSVLIDRGRREEGRIRASQVMDTGVDYYTVEEFLRELLLLADFDRAGLVKPEDFLNLLHSQALYLHLSYREQELLLRRVKHMQDGQIPYAALVPHMGIVLQEVKAEAQTPPSLDDWCNFYSHAVNDVVFWNVRTSEVTRDVPDGLDVNDLNEAMAANHIDVEMEVLKALLKAMEDKDLGKSGFLTPKEFTGVLLSASCPIKISPAEAEQVLFHCGADLGIEMGIPYLNHIPVIRGFISQVQSAVSSVEEDEDYSYGWSLAYFPAIGLFYQHKESGTVQNGRPPHALLDVGQENT